MTPVYICDYIRTPIGRFGGALSSVRADDLGAIPLRALMARNPGTDWEAVDDVIFGCANQAGEDNRNVARMSLLLAGLPMGVSGTTINRLCGSGMDAILTAARAITAGEAGLHYFTLRKGYDPGARYVAHEAAALKAMQNAAQELQQVIASSPELKEMLGIVDIKVEADGLNIEIMDTDKISMFELGSSRINSVSEAAFQKIGAFIAKLPNNVDIVGHTDAKPFASQRRGGYSNWELSADRANAARRLLEKGGVDPKRFTSVVGRADQELRVPTEPFASSNRRITVKMRFNPALVPAAPPTALEDFSRIENQFRDGQRSIAPAAASPPQAKAAEISPEAAAATAEVLPPNAVVSSNPNQKIKLPREAPPTMNPNIMPRDKIFGDVPGFVPVDPFATP
jgi:flagellar motor protein MotB